MDSKQLLGAMCFFCTCVSGFTTTVSAEDVLDNKKWSDDAELSYVATGGNSDVETLAARNLFKLRFVEKFTFIWRLEALRGRTRGAPSAERYATDLRLEYGLSNRAYLYSGAGWQRDNFAGPDYRVSLSVGGGYKFLTGPRSFFKLEGGVNSAKERYVGASDRRLTEERLFGEYIYAFTNKNKFTQSVETLRDLDDSSRFRVNTETAMVTVLNHRFSFKVSYQIKYNNQPVPATLEKQDRVLSSAIVASF